MNRKLKFRIYEPMNKKMHYVNFGLYINEINSNRWILPLEHQHNEGNYTIMNLDAVKIMQYTGLKDKNGIEIYEGDKVKIDYKKIYQYQRESDYGEIIYSEYFSGFYFCFNDEEKHIQPINSPLGSQVYGIFVIGNIYDNEDK